MNRADEPYLAKARESLAGAESELAAGRYNNAANRAYYAAFQAAIHALATIGVRRTLWGHDFVQAQFSAQFIQRRKVFRSDMRSILSQIAIIRERADYQPLNVSQAQARLAVRLAIQFVEEVGEAR